MEDQSALAAARCLTQIEHFSGWISAMGFWSFKTLGNAAFVMRFAAPSFLATQHMQDNASSGCQAYLLAKWC